MIEILRDMYPYFADIKFWLGFGFGYVFALIWLWNTFILEE